MKNCTLLLLLALMFFSCDTGGVKTARTYVFTNNSSFSISISPNRQNWSGFMLSPGARRECTIYESEIRFLYNQSDWYYSSTSGNSVSFHDATLYAYGFENQTRTVINIAPQENDNAQDWTEFDLLPLSIVILRVPYQTLFFRWGPTSGITTYHDYERGLRVFCPG